MSGNGNGNGKRGWWVFAATMLTAIIGLLGGWASYNAGQRNQGAVAQSVSDRLDAFEDHVRKSEPLITMLYETNTGMRENKAHIAQLITQVERLARLQEQDREQSSEERQAINESIRHLTAAVRLQKGGS